DLLPRGAGLEVIPRRDTLERGAGGGLELAEDAGQHRRRFEGRGVVNVAAPVQRHQEGVELVALLVRDRRTGSRAADDAGPATPGRVRGTGGGGHDHLPAGAARLGDGGDVPLAVGVEARLVLGDLRVAGDVLAEDPVEPMHPAGRAGLDPALVDDLTNLAQPRDARELRDDAEGG